MRWSGAHQSVAAAVASEGGREAVDWCGRFRALGRWPWAKWPAGPVGALLGRTQFRSRLR